MNRFKATLAIAAFSIFALTACGGDATKVADDAKNAVDQTAKTATEGATKAGEGAMKAGDAAKDAVGGVATKAGEGAMKAGDTAKDAAAKVATKAGEGAMKAEDTAKDAAAKVAGNVTGAAGLLSLTQTIPGLKTGVTATLDAVKKGDFKAAKEEATKLQESWTKVSDVVKTKSGGSFDKISSTLKTVQTELGESSPDKAKIVSDLTSLSSSVAGLVSIK
jgi:hypothetical protein